MTSGGCTMCIIILDEKLNNLSMLSWTRTQSRIIDSDGGIITNSFPNKIYPEFMNIA